MIILTDVDGVLADFVGGLCLELAGRGYDKSPEDVHHWDLSESFSPDEMRNTLEIMGAPGFCHTLEWYAGAREFLRDLAALGQVHAVTAPFLNGPSWMHERHSWLSRTTACTSSRASTSTSSAGTCSSKTIPRMRPIGWKHTRTGLPSSSTVPGTVRPRKSSGLTPG